jgi:hypothetical protein
MDLDHRRFAYRWLDGFSRLGGLEVCWMRIILVRYGETNENASHRYLGHYDAELNLTVKN